MVPTKRMIFEPFRIKKSVDHRIIIIRERKEKGHHHHHIPPPRHEREKTKRQSKRMKTSLYLVKVVDVTHVALGLERHTRRRRRTRAAKSQYSQS